MHALKCTDEKGVFISKYSGKAYFPPSLKKDHHLEKINRIKINAGIESPELPKQSIVDSKKEILINWESMVKGLTASRKMLKSAMIFAVQHADDATKVTFSRFLIF